MPRPCCIRHVGYRPHVYFFKPAGVPIRALEIVTLTLDEVEALRLADLEGYYQEQAAEQMKISRPTFARIVEAARRKTADALIHGKAIRLKGGAVTMKEDADMPIRDGTGALERAMGQGRGPCGCGQRRGWVSGCGAGSWGGGRGVRRGSAAVADREAKAPRETKIGREAEET